MTIEYNDSAIMRFADSELTAAGYPDGPGRAGWLHRRVMECVKQFVMQPWRGTDASLAADMIKKLGLGLPLSPLTFSASEWREPLMKGEPYVNKRKPSVIKTADGIIYETATHICKPFAWYDGVWRKSSDMPAVSAWLFDNDGMSFTGRFMFRGIIRDIPYIAREPVRVSCQVVDCGAGGKIYTVNVKDSRDMRLVTHNTDVEWFRCEALAGVRLTDLTPELCQRELESLKEAEKNGTLQRWEAVPYGW